jgi:hypothetical protein
VFIGGDECHTQCWAANVGVSAWARAKNLSMDGGGEGTVFGWWIDQMVDVVHGEVTRMHEAPFGFDFDIGSLLRSFSSLLRQKGIHGCIVYTAFVGKWLSIVQDTSNMSLCESKNLGLIHWSSPAHNCGQVLLTSGSFLLALSAFTYHGYVGHTKVDKPHIASCRWASDL